LPSITVLLIALLVQEHAAGVVALLVLQPCGAVLRCSVLGFEDAVAVMRPMDCLDAPCCFLRLLERNVDAKGEVLAIRAFPVADRDLLYVSILSKELRFPQSLEQVFFTDCRSQASDVDQVFLDDSDPDEVFAVLLFCLAFLKLFDPLVLGSSPLVLLDIRPELGNSGWRLAT
jgi:hypothetical protein